MLESLYFDTLLKGLFYGLNVAISFFLIYNYVRSRRAIVLNAGIFAMFMAAFLAIIDIGVMSSQTYVGLHSSFRFLIFITSATCFQLLMVLKYATNSFNNNGITDTYLAMCFGLTVFSTIVGPFLAQDMSIAASIILLLFIGLFASGFSLYILKDDQSGSLSIVSTLIASVIATALGLLIFLDINFSLVYQKVGIHFIVSVSTIALTILLTKDSTTIVTEITDHATVPPTGNVAKLIANDRLKDEHVAMVAHELRTPLGGIIGISDLLMEGAEGDLPPEVNLNLKLISESSKKLTYLLNDLLDLTKIKNEMLQVKPVPVHLRSLVSKVLALQYSTAITKGIELKNNVPKDFPNVLADTGKLEQILHNLIGNSAKFTDEGYISIDVEAHDDTVMIVIEDTGKGLSKDNLQGILESFEGDLVQSTGFGHNTGLGLKISNRLIELHGSKLVMESAEGFGSYFSFTLPITVDDAPVNEDYENYSIGARAHSQGITKIRPHRNARIGEKFRIMVVDDEIINVKVLIAQLNRVGYEVLTYYNGQSALQALKEGILPDLILLDIMMPNMNGFEVCQEIRKEFSQVELPIIMLTAKNHTTDILDAFKAGANDYIAKPIAKDELLARIKTHVELSKINHAFSRFVPHEFLGFLGYDSVLEIKLGDQVQKNMAVLFSDIKDFTRLSENMTPKEAFDFINTFLGVVSPLIREHGGFIDKFIGDAIMALFPGGADDATKAAISMTKKLKVLNEERLVQGLEPIQVGTGLHTGDLMLGTIGEEMRMEGTVISDVVNTASRLEGLTKLFDSRVIISSHVKSELSSVNDLHFRYLGKSRVKGKNNVLDVYGIIEGDDEKIMELELKSADAFEAGINNFYKKNFTNASVNFNEVLKINPKDKAASIFLKRSAHLMITGVPDNWSGVDEGMSLLERDYL